MALELGHQRLQLRLARPPRRRHECPSRPGPRRTLRAPPASRCRGSGREAERVEHLARVRVRGLGLGLGLADQLEHLVRGRRRQVRTVRRGAGRAPCSKCARVGGHHPHPHPPLTPTLALTPALALTLAQSSTWSSGGGAAARPAISSTLGQAEAAPEREELLHVDEAHLAACRQRWAGRPPGRVRVRARARARLPD